MDQERRLEVIRNGFACVEGGHADPISGARLLVHVPGSGASIHPDAPELAGHSAAVGDEV